MWASDPAAYSKATGMPFELTWQYQCTAEHLVDGPRGGASCDDNIVAACVYCNRARHVLFPELEAAEFRQIVQRRMAAGEWHLADVSWKPALTVLPGRTVWKHGGKAGRDVEDISKVIPDAADRRDN